MPLEKCYSCPYARWVSAPDTTEPKIECDPPMGECPAEQVSIPEEEENILKHGHPQADEDIEAWQQPYKNKKGGK